MSVKPGWLRFISPFTIVQDRHLIGLSDNQVILTFDDGPNGHHQTTERLLDVLQARNIKACFCVIGQQALQQPHTIRRIHDEGHLIVNHSQSHGVPLVQSTEQIRQEIATCDETLGEILGIPNYRSRAFRPPAGLLTPAIKQVVQEDGLKIVPISFYAVDTLYHPGNYQYAVNRMLQDAHRNKGGVYVLHDGLHVLWNHDLKILAPKRGPTHRHWIPQGVTYMINSLTQAGMIFLDPTNFFKVCGAK